MFGPESKFCNGQVPIQSLLVHCCQAVFLNPQTVDVRILLSALTAPVGFPVTMEVDPLVSEHSPVDCGRVKPTRPVPTGETTPRTFWDGYLL